MKYRIAKISDAKRIAEIQSKIKDVNDLGIFCHMGRNFLRKYYQLMIEDPESLFLCAENEKGVIEGYHFIILDASKQNEYLKKNKIGLALSAIGSIIAKPKLLKELWKRYKSVKSDDETYLHNEGAHGGYWGWDPEYPNSEASLYLHELCLFIAKNLGVTKMHFEVDKQNKSVYKFHKINGAITEKSFVLPDGRERIFMHYDLTNHKFRL